MPLNQSLAMLSLRSDLTETILASAAMIPPGQVVTLPEFSLFQGTQALEVNNPRLDSSLLPLDPAAVAFDTTAERTVDEIEAIIDGLFSGFSAWLNNSSLALTALSCQYCERLLLNYNHPQSRQGLADCHFLPAALPPSEGASHDLTHTVLRGFVVGYLRFIGFVVLMGKSGVIYEEEDIVSNTFGLSFLQEVPLEAVMETVTAAETMARLHAKRLLPLFSLLRSLLRIETILAINLGEKLVDWSYVDETLLLLRERVVSDPLGAPPGCFSTIFQTRVDNNLPPKPLPAFRDYRECLTGLFRDLEYASRVVREAPKVAEKPESPEQPQRASGLGAETPGGAWDPRDLQSSRVQHFMYWFSTRRLRSANVIIRMLVQLWIIRDDKSILGSSFRLFDMMVNDMNRTCTVNTTIMEILETGLGGTPPPEGTKNWAEIASRIPPLLTSLEGGYYEILCLYSQNPPRQRQHVNRLLVLFDTLQVETESFEVLVHDSLAPGTGDIFERGAQTVPQVPLSSYIYGKKLGLMIEMLFRGVELNLYKPFELLSVYWYVAYLLECMLQHLKGRLMRINEQQQALIDKAKMAKKLKKLTGEKKVKYKSHMEHQLQAFSRLQAVQARLEAEVGYHTLLLALATATRMYLSVAKAEGRLPEPKYSRITPERMYQYRFKPFSSIGVPEQPSFTQFSDSVSQCAPSDARQVARLLDLARERVSTALTGFAQPPVEAMGWELNRTDAVEWYQRLRVSATHLQSLMNQKADPGQITIHGHIDNLEDCHPWFPRFQI